MTRSSAVYPITANLEAEAAPVAETAIARAIIDAVGEYEHGAADLENMTVEGGLTLKQYAAVALDLILILDGGPPRVQVHDQRDFKGTQSWNREAILSINEHKCKVEIKHDSYRFQSYARLSRWDGSKWQHVVHIPHAELTSWQGAKPFSYVESAPPVQAWNQDCDELVRLALLVLG